MGIQGNVPLNQYYNLYLRKSLITEEILRTRLNLKIFFPTRKTYCNKMCWFLSPSGSKNAANKPGYTPLSAMNDPYACSFRDANILYNSISCSDLTGRGLLTTPTGHLLQIYWPYLRRPKCFADLLPIMVLQQSYQESPANLTICKYTGTLAVGWHILLFIFQPIRKSRVIETKVIDNNKQYYKIRSVKWNWTQSDIPHLRLAATRVHEKKRDNLFSWRQIASVTSEHLANVAKWR